MRKWMIDFAEDLLMLAGLGVFIYTTFLMHVIAGLYATAFSLMAVSVLLSRIKPGGGKR